MRYLTELFFRSTFEWTTEEEVESVSSCRGENRCNETTADTSALSVDKTTNITIPRMENAGVKAVIPDLPNKLVKKTRM